MAKNVNTDISVDEGEWMKGDVVLTPSSSLLRHASSGGVLSNRLLYLLIGIFLFPGFQTPSGEEILRRCQQNFSEIEDYTVDLEATIDMERMRMPNMKAMMYFRKPDKIRIKSEGFMMLPREGFGMPVATLIKHYDADLKGRDTVEEISCYRLQLTAKNPSRAVQSMFVWVDPAHFTIVKTATVPYRNRSVTVRFEYGLQESRYWLPVKLIADFSSTQPDTVESDDAVIPMKPQLQEFRRPPRNGSIEIRYANYRVNTGLSDELFREESE